jgi:hypothetical protein
MVEAACYRPKIKGGAGEYAVKEVALKAGVCFEERAKVADVVCVQVGGPCGEGTYGLKISTR